MFVNKYFRNESCIRKRTGRAELKRAEKLEKLDLIETLIKEIIKWVNIQNWLKKL